jgi:hypothetical protein
MSDAVKQVIVSADSFKTRGTRKRRSSALKGDETRRIHKEQHGGTSPGTVVALAASRGPITANAPVVKASNIVDVVKSSTNSTPAPVTEGGSKTPQAHVKVVLAAGKKKSRVILTPAKVKKLPAAPQQAKTRKVAKRIRMSLNGFGKRVTRANHIRHETKKQKIEEVKKTLVEAKLIKVDSKAPESVLRQMLSDYMMLKNRAL